MAQHLSVFVQNQPGKLNSVTELFAAERINIRAFSIASAGDFGILKLLVNDPEKAYRLLRAQGHTVSKREIIIAVIEDTPGSLHSLFSGLQEAVNIEDSYGFLLEKGKSAAIILETPETEKAKAILAKLAIPTMEDPEIYSL